MWDSLAIDLSTQMLERIGLTLLAGFILGVERERHGRAAGLRTILLVSLSSCVAMVVSEEFYFESVRRNAASSWHPDPARLAAGILTGMGFIGAGVILRQSQFAIRGVTTAATLWFATVMGLAFGAGAVAVGALATLLAFLILILLPLVERHIQDDWYSVFTVQLDPQAASAETIVGELQALGVRVKGLDVEADLQRGRRRIVFHLKYKHLKGRRGDLLHMPLEVTERVGKLPGVESTHWQA